MSKVYAFDVDETMYCSNGPVTLDMLVTLRKEGHIVGLCGNWGLFCQVVPNWQDYVSFINCTPAVFDQPTYGDWNLAKVWFMQHFRQYIRAEEYILVGNIKGELNSLGVVCGSEDNKFAAMAGWRFIKEDDFSRGVR